MKVTIGVIALNEENNILDILDNINNQTYDLKKIQVLLVDSVSNDNTKEIMLDFKNKNIEKFLDIKVLDNEKKYQPAGWNIVIENSIGDVIIRLDAHSLIPNNFVEKNVQCILSGESVCGGRRKNIIKGNTTQKRVLLLAENNMFGSGIAGYRQNESNRYVPTIAHACYKREVFDKVGLFDERLLRAEDNDMHYRIRQAGYQICSNSEISSEYQTRPTLKGMLKQKFGNGKFIGIGSILKTPSMFSIYHFVPLLFVLGILATTICAICGVIMPLYAFYYALPAITMWGMYLLLLLSISFATAIKEKLLLALFELPIVIFLLHFFYGFGTCYGIIVGLIKKAKRS